MKKRHERLTLLMMATLAIWLLSACAGGPAGQPDDIESLEDQVEPTPEAEEPLSLPAPGTPLVFSNGLVVTATGAEPIQGGVVVVENGVITGVGPEGSVTLPAEVAVIDLGGKTIMPGLIEGRASALLSNLVLKEGDLDGIYADLYLRKPLELGITTMRAAGWTWEGMQQTPVMQAALEAQGNSIPTVLIAGASLAHSEGPAFTKYYPQQTVGVGTVDEAIKITQETIELGADQVNFLMSSGPSLDETLEERSPVLSSEMLVAIVETAHARDTLAVGQALFPEEAMAAIEAGADEITSWPSPDNPMPDALIEAAVANSVPFLSGFSVEIPPEGEVRRFLDAGGILVFGTFAPNSGSTPAREFERMTNQGMTPMEMIQSATVNAANALGLGDEVGTLEVGKLADIIVVNGNPFEDNFSSVMGDVVYVVKNGDLVVHPDG